MNPYVVFLLYGLSILGFLAVTLSLDRLLGPRRKVTPIKLEPFECGANPVDPMNVRAVPVKYYALAIMFVLFDLETVFLVLWTLAARPLTGWLLATLVAFVALLALILAYVWKSGLFADVTE